MSRFGTAAAKLGLTFWFGAMLLVGSSLLGRHLLALPAPPVNLEAIARLRAPGESGLMTVHVLYASCRCSQRVAEHLLDTARVAAANEHVLFVGQDDELERRFAAKGFLLHHVESQELRNAYGIEAAPSFVVIARDGTVRYAGGYTARKQGLDWRDLAIIADAKADISTASIPVYGCAVSKELKSTVNPLGVP